MPLRKRVIAAVLMLAAAGGIGVACAQNAPPTAVQTCGACHGQHGQGNAAAGFPRLAGLNAAYLQRQLDSFANGSRKSSVMQPIAQTLSETQRHAVAAYYSKLPIPAAAARGSASPPDDPLGKKLAMHGLWAKQVPGCVQCHGPHGVGVGAHFPPLAGQSATYIANQLRDWQQGKRKNDPLGLMQHVASALSEADIKAVSEWFAAQPAAAHGDTP